RFLALRDPERTFLAACRARIASVLDDEIGAAIAALMARQDEADLAGFAAGLDATRVDPRSFAVACGAVLRHDIRSRASWQGAAAAVEQVTARDPRWLGVQ